MVKAHTPHTVVKPHTPHTMVKPHTPHTMVKPYTPHTTVKPHTMVKPHTPHTVVKPHTPHTMVKPHTPHTMVKPHTVVVTTACDGHHQKVNVKKPVHLICTTRPSKSNTWVTQSLATQQPRFSILPPKKDWIQSQVVSIAAYCFITRLLLINNCLKCCFVRESVVTVLLENEYKARDILKCIWVLCSKRPPSGLSIDEIVSSADKKKAIHG